MLAAQLAVTDAIAETRTDASHGSRPENDATVELELGRTPAGVE